MWGVLDCVYIETCTYKAFGGHVVGGWGDVSKSSAIILHARVDETGNRRCLSLVVGRCKFATAISHNNNTLCQKIISLI